MLSTPLAPTKARDLTVMEVLAHFHFLRPEWLLLGPALLLFERLLRSTQTTPDRFSGIIDPA